MTNRPVFYKRLILLAAIIPVVHAFGQTTILVQPDNATLNTVYTYNPANTEVFPIYDDNYDLIFEDDFNTFDANKWYTNYLGVHTLKVGIEYQSLSDNISSTGSTLKLIAKEITPQYFKVADYEDDNVIRADGYPNKRLFSYSSGMLHSQHNYKYGKFVLRCKLPLIDGVWPAFWLFGGHETVSELDIFEFNRNPTGEPTTYNNQTYYDDNPLVASQKWFCTYHKWGQNNTDVAQGFKARASNFSYANAWHEYGMIWDEYKIIWTLDGAPVYGYYHYYASGTTPLPIPDHATLTLYEQQGKTIYRNAIFPVDPMDVIVGLGVKKFSGGYNSMNNPPQSSGIFPVEMEVDYLRIYQNRTCGQTLSYCEVEDLPSVVAASDINIGGSSNCEQTIHERDNVELIASNSIYLKSGFHAQLKGDFKAKIQNCSTADLRLANTNNMPEVSIFLDTVMFPKLYSPAVLEKPAQRDLTYRVWPNPSNGLLYFIGEFNTGTVTIMDLENRVIAWQPYTGKQLSFELSGISKGIYLLKVQTNTEVSISKVVID